ncbi:MAG: AsnC family transcriptional regulator [Chloroflexi bacterium]|nr:MAG: AsnC family transcriptional regulator [Chloroflexota bacterium]PIE81183.1 MAG: AsnC family transcriptional regulator [Chloroflexota bacterium]
MQKTSDIELDELDLSILRTLQENGRMSNVDLANHINLSPPATYTRLKRLEKQGYIHHYAALLNWKQMGYDMICFINISLQMHQPGEVEKFRKRVSNLPEVMECHHVTGEFDYLLKVAIKNREDLDRFVMKQLTPIPGIGRIYTSLALNEIKATTALPI